MVIREANKYDVEYFFNGRSEKTIRALVIENEGNPVAIAGVFHSFPLQCFSVLTDSARKSPKTIVKCAKKLRNILNSYSGDILAIADKNEPSSARFLKYVGFIYRETNSQGEIYEWPWQSR